MMEVWTVTGPIAASELGVTSLHDHIMADNAFSGDDPNKKYDDPELMIREVAHFRRAGGRTIVELTTRGLGQDAQALRRISQESAVQIVAATGFYRSVVYPEYVFSESADQLAQRMIRDIEIGIEDTDVRAGIIGELAAEFPGETLSKDEEKVFRAAARAARATGLAISTHCWQGEAAMAMIKVLTEEGVQPRRIVIGHLAVAHGLRDRVARIADRGVFLGIDAIGYQLEDFADPDRAAMVKFLIDKGYLSQITIAQDMMRKSFLKEFGGHGYDYLLRSFVPMLREAGVTDGQIHTMLVDTPGAVLAG